MELSLKKVSSLGAGPGATLGVDSARIRIEVAHVARKLDIRQPQRLLNEKRRRLEQLYITPADFYYVLILIYEKKEGD